MTPLRRVEEPTASPLRTEFVDRSALSQGDDVLVVPGEQAGVDGRIVNAAVAADDVPGSTPAVQGEAVIEDVNGEHRPARVGGRIGAAETVAGGPVVVRTGRPALVPWLRSAVGVVESARSSPRLVAVVLVLVVALAGVGLGWFGPDGGSDGGAADPRSPTSTESTPPTPTPPPSVTATPPAPTTDDSETTTRHGGSIDVSVADPEEVRQRDGLPTTVSAALGGNVRTDERADSAVVVVQSWVPGHGWTETARTTTTADTVSLGDLFGEVVLASGDRASGFDNPRDGTTAVFRGRVSVTAVLFDGGQEIGRLSATDGYTIRVTNLAAPSGDLVLGDGEVTGSLFGADGLRSGDDSADSSPGVVPGSSGENTVAITNGGSEAGTLTLSDATVVSFENGRSGPESAVDDTGGDPGRGAGELDDALEVRLALERVDGNRAWVFGNETAFRSIGALADEPIELGTLAPGERVELIVEYRLPESVGNEIQTDSIVVDISFTLSGADD